MSTKLADMLQDSGLDAQESARASYVLIDYLFGSIALEAAELSYGPKGSSEAERIAARYESFSAIPAGAYPLSAGAAAIMATYVSTEQYMWGLHGCLMALLAGERRAGLEPALSPAPVQSLPGPPASAVGLYVEARSDSSREARLAGKTGSRGPDGDVVLFVDTFARGFRPKWPGPPRASWTQPRGCRTRPPNCSTTPRIGWRPVCAALPPTSVNWRTLAGSLLPPSPFPPKWFSRPTATSTRCLAALYRASPPHVLGLEQGV